MNLAVAGHNSLSCCDHVLHPPPPSPNSVSRSFMVLGMLEIKVNDSLKQTGKSESPLIIVNTNTVAGA